MQAIIGTLAVCALYVAWHWLVFDRLMDGPVITRLAGAGAAYVTAALILGGAWLACSIGLIATLLRAVGRGMQVREDGNRSTALLGRILEM